MTTVGVPSRPSCFIEYQLAIRLLHSQLSIPLICREVVEGTGGVVWEVVVHPEHLRCPFGRC